METASWIAASGTVALVLVTGVLAYAAVRAYCAATREAEQNRQHFQKQLAQAELARKAALKPWVTPERIVHFDNNLPLKLNIRNIGAGPALDTAVSLWFDDQPPVESEPESSRKQRLQALRVTSTPTGTAEGGDTAAGDGSVCDVWLSFWNANSQGCFAYVVVGFSDVYGEPFETTTVIRIFQDDPVGQWVDLMTQD